MTAFNESAPIDEEYISDCYSEEEYASDGDSEEEYLEKIYAEMNKQDDQTDLPQIEPLLKPQYNTTEEALSQFNRVFEKRYGSDLAFRQTSMKAAAAEAADGPEIATQKPIFMYLHSDSSITANKFASDVLSDSRISALLKEKFVPWGFDCTLCGKLGNVVSWLMQLSADDIAESLQYTQINEFPLILVLHKDQGVLKQSIRISNDESSDAVFAKLEQSIDQFEQVKSRLMVESDSLADQKPQSSQPKFDYEAFKKRHADEMHASAVYRDFQEDHWRMEKLLAKLPEEPTANDPDAITIHLTSSNGRKNIRRFSVHHSLQFLLDYAGSRGYFEDKVRIVTSDSFRRDIATFDKTMSFKNLKWSRHSQLTIETI